MSKTYSVDKQDLVYLGLPMLLGCVILFSAGYLSASFQEPGIDTDNFQEIMDEATVETLEHANQSFSEGQNETGFTHTKSGMTMVWANLQVTEEPLYDTIWKEVSFGCFIDENPSECQELVIQTIDILKDDEPQNGNTEAGDNTSRPEFGDSISYSAEVE